MGYTQKQISPLIQKIVSKLSDELAVWKDIQTIVAHEDRTTGFAQEDPGPLTMALLTELPDMMKAIGQSDATVMAGFRKLRDALRDHPEWNSNNLRASIPSAITSIEGLQKELPQTSTIDAIPRKFLENSRLYMHGKITLEQCIAQVYSNTVFTEWVKTLSKSQYQAFLVELAQTLTPDFTWPQGEEPQNEKERMTQLLSTPLKKLGLIGKHSNSLIRAKKSTLGHIVSMTAEEAQEIPGFGENSFAVVDTMISGRNLTWGMNLKEYSDPTTSLERLQALWPQYLYMLQTFLTRDVAWQQKRALLATLKPYLHCLKNNVRERTGITLYNNNLHTIGHIIQETEEQVAFILDEGSFKALKEFMAQNGLSFGMNLSEYELEK